MGRARRRLTAGTKVKIKKGVFPLGYPILRLACGGRTGRYFVVLMLGGRRGWVVADDLRTVRDRDRVLGRAVMRFQALMSDLGERRMDELAGWLSERLRDPA